MSEGPKTATNYRDLAIELRREASGLMTSGAKKGFLSLADDYDQMASALECAAPAAEKPNSN